MDRLCHVRTRRLLLSSPILPADDERDNLLNVLPHAQFLGNGIYEYLPALSRGNGHGVPTPTARAEHTTVKLRQGSAKGFEAAIAAEQSRLRGETLWYRMLVGGDGPRYVRLRPRANLAAILDERADQALPERANRLVSKITFLETNDPPVKVLFVYAANPLASAPSNRRFAAGCRATACSRSSSSTS